MSNLDMQLWKELERRWNLVNKGVLPVRKPKPHNDLRQPKIFTTGHTP